MASRGAQGLDSRPMRRNLGWILRAFALIAVLSMALYAFRSGVDVSARPGLPEAGPLTQLYYSFGLFVLGGLDLGTPSGGPVFAQEVLWGAYFLAPLITTSAVVEGAIYLMGSGILERFGLRGHLVIVGLGRLGAAFVTAYRERHPDQVILGLDRGDTSAARTLARRYHHIRLIPGDVRVPRTLEMLSLNRARGIALLTADDLLNLEFAFRAAKSHPGLLVIAHVSDVALQRQALDVRDRAERSGLHVFNAHRAAAEHLYQNHLRDYFRDTKGKDTVVLAGFGRFGQTILEFLEDQAGGELARVIVVDRTAGARLRVFRAQVDQGRECQLTTLDADLGDPDTWVAIERAVGSPEAAPVIVVGSDDDRVNLSGAIQARRRWPSGKILVRCQDESSFTEEIATQYDFTVLAVNAVLLDALRNLFQRWKV